MTVDLKGLETPRAFARRCGVTTNRIYGCIYSGMPSVEVAGRVMIPVVQATKWRRDRERLACYPRKAATA